MDRGIDVDVYEWHSHHDNLTNASTRQSFSSNELPSNYGSCPNDDPEDFLVIPRLVIPRFTSIKGSEAFSLLKAEDSVRRIEQRQVDPIVVPVKDTDTDGTNSDNSEIDSFDLYNNLKDRFSGHRGNSLLMSLIDMAELNTPKNRTRNPKSLILNQELEKLLNFSRKRNMRVQAFSEFHLLEYIKANADNNQTSSMLRAIDDLDYNVERYSTTEMAKAKHRYIQKKNRRIGKDYIRYKDRQELANTRVRVKGMFIKKVNINIAEVVKEFGNKC